MRTIESDYNNGKKRTNHRRAKNNIPEQWERVGGKLGLIAPAELVILVVDVGGAERADAGVGGGWPCGGVGNSAN